MADMISIILSLAWLGLMFVIGYQLSATQRNLREAQRNLDEVQRIRHGTRQREE